MVFSAACLVQAAREELLQPTGMLVSVPTSPSSCLRIIPRTMKSGGLMPKRVSETQDCSMSQLTNTPGATNCPAGFLSCKTVNNLFHRINVRIRVD